MLATITFTTADLVAVIGVSGVLGLFFWVGRTKPVPPRLEQERAVDYDLASGKWVHPRAHERIGL